MKAEQMLFTFEAELSMEPHWILTEQGIDDAANIVIEQLKKKERPVYFNHVAAIRCGLEPNALVPQDKAKFFSDNRKKIHDDRYRIREAVEARSEYVLVVIGEKGESARMNGRAPAYGFDLRDSVAGAQDDKAQIRLGVGLIKKAFTRTPALRDDADIQARLAIPNLLSDCNEKPNDSDI
jgi:hypothetical protein